MINVFIINVSKLNFLKERKTIAEQKFSFNIIT